MISQDLLWWLNVVQVPALSGLLVLCLKFRADLQEASKELMRFKIEVAKTYAAHNDLQTLEMRLVTHLLRIEKKLDHTALKTAALSGKGDP